MAQVIIPGLSATTPARVTCPSCTAVVEFEVADLLICTGSGPTSVEGECPHCHSVINKIVSLEWADTLHVADKIDPRKNQRGEI